MGTNGNYIQNQFCNYEIALKLKELGFDEECLGIYEPELNINSYGVGVNWNTENVNDVKKEWCSAPLLQQAIDWFREKYNIHIYIDFYDGLYGFAIKLNKEKLYNRCGSFEPGFKNYSDAREQAILKAIELCQKEK